MWSYTDSEVPGTSIIKYHIQLIRYKSNATTANKQKSNSKQSTIPQWKHLFPLLFMHYLFKAM